MSMFTMYIILFGNKFLFFVHIGVLINVFGMFEL